MQPTPGPTQADTVYERLRSDILSCRLRPGARIRINEIAESLGVSLGAVREALSRLAAEDMALATAQKGYQVPPVSLEDLRNLTEARVAVERLCLQDAATNPDIEWETELAASFHRLQRLPEREPSDPARINEAWSAAHGLFHAALVSGCRNLWLLKIRAQLYAQTERYRRLSVPLRRTERDIAAEHRAIFDAMMARDATLVCQLIGEHLLATADIVATALSLEAAPEDLPARAAQRDGRRAPRTLRSTAEQRRRAAR